MTVTSDRMFISCDRSTVGDVTSVGEFVWSMLHEPDFCAQVIASFSDAFYFVGPRRELAWVGQLFHPAHRRAILTPFRIEPVKVGGRIRMNSEELIVDGLGKISLVKRALWSRDRLNPRRLVNWDDLRTAIPAHFAVIRDLPNRCGLGHALDLVMNKKLIASDENKEFLDQALWRVANRPVCEIIDALQCGDIERAVLIGEKLIGLGRGLTPSGDDYVGGMLFTAHHLWQAYGGRVRWPTTRIRKLQNYVQGHTNQISSTLFGDLCHGQGPDLLHAFTRSFLHGEDPSNTYSIAKSLIRIGSSSGWDVLAGAVTGMLLVMGSDR